MALSFSTLSFIKIFKAEEDELPAPKEQLSLAAMIIAIVGSLFIAVSLPFINYKNTIENKIKIQLNEKL